MPDDLNFFPFETMPAGSGPDALRNVLIVCDHASNDVPPEIGTLGLSDADMSRHIAWDVGARGVAVDLAERLGAGLIMSRFSRLVIDPNRDPADPTLVMKLYDGSIVPGNSSVGPEEIERRLTAYHRPYHAALSAAIDGIEAEGLQPVLISIHSYTPQLAGKPLRPWHIGVLWNRDDRLVRPLLAALRAETDLVIGDNEPYSGELAGDCMNTLGTQRGVAHALIEIRSDLISDPAGERTLAARLAPILRHAVALTRQEAV